MNFECPRQLIKFFGTYLLYNEAQNYHNNFTLKIQKIDTKLNIWLSRDLTVFGRTLLAKSLGLSQLVYIASMNTVPEGTIQQVQSKLFSFLWKNERDKIKRSVLYQPFSKGGLNFPRFSFMVKALRLSWINRLLSNSDQTWKAVPNFYFEKFGGLPFLMNCNFETSKLPQTIPTFYSELLDFFKELRSNFDDPTGREFILWNNRDITIDNKSFFRKTWSIKNVNFIQDLLDEHRNFLSFEEFKSKFKLKVNFLEYYQVVSAIPKYLKDIAFQSSIPKRNEVHDVNVYQLTEGKTILFDKM